MEKEIKKVKPQPEELIKNLQEKKTEKKETKKSHSISKKSSSKSLKSISKRTTSVTKPKSKSKSTSNNQKKTTKKNSKSSTKTSSTKTGRKWNEKSTEHKKGKITPEEGQKITEALCEYAFENSLSSSEIVNLLTEKQKKDNKVWPKIAECLPGRSVQSIHNYCHRTFHPNNYKGFWTKKEEEDLISLVKEHGKKWELIGKTLQRTATNVKDKYKQLGGDNHNKVNIETNLSYKLKLLKEIESYLNDNDKDEDSKTYMIFKHTYCFNSSLENECDLLFKYDEVKDKFIIDSSLKTERSKCIIRNIFKQLINFDGISEILEDKVEISWTVISNNLKFFSVDECRNEWNKIIREFNLDEMINKKRDYKMIKKLVNNGIESKDDISWEIIKNKRSQIENQQRLDDLLRTTDIYNVKTFSENINKIKDELEKELYKNENESDEYKEEEKKRKERDISYIYDSFLKRKRGAPVDKK